LANLIVSVPRSLSVSEAHGIKPRADIVWREDPPGDRYVQVEGILRDALTPTLSTMQGEVPVQVVIEVTRFRVERRARYTIGGQHEIEFVYSVRHAETGAILSPPQPVDLTFRGSWRTAGGRGRAAGHHAARADLRAADRLGRRDFPDLPRWPWRKRPAPDPFRAVKTGVRGMPCRHPPFPF
jgi:hypothetical protein